MSSLFWGLLLVLFSTYSSPALLKNVGQNKIVHT
jgi:hypothetical protein